MPPTRRCVLSFVLVLLVMGGMVGCGSSKMGPPPKSTTPTRPVESTTASTTTTSEPPPPAGVSYSVNGVQVDFDNFTFDFSAKLTLGAATTNTDGQEPPYENVEAPISGGATLTNTTSGYTVDPDKLPLLGIFAIYPKGSPVCGQLLNGPRFDPGPSSLCGIDIAEFAASCDQTVEPLGDGDSVQLVPWAQFMLSELQPGTPQPCANATDFQIPDTFSFKRVNATDADAVVAGLAKPPRYWALVLEDGPTQTGVDPATGEGPDCGFAEGGDLIGQVIASQPNGLKGCLGE